MVSLKEFMAWFLELSEVFKENREYLTELDSAIGDADHGINLDRGFSAVRADLESKEYSSVRDLLKSVAMILIKTVGGASGPLLGTCFLQMSRTSVSEKELGPKELVDLFKAGLKGIMTRGKAVEGEKTMIDTWAPAVRAMEDALTADGSVEDIFSGGVKAAEEGMKSTIPMLATKGRASYLGERSVGHQDPGATSSFMMMKAASEIWT